jgi:hypothetical protein
MTMVVFIITLIICTQKKKTKNQRKRAPKGRSQVGMCEMKLIEWEWKSAHKKGFETWLASLSEKN